MKTETKKYEFTGETMKQCDIKNTLHRIRALRDFGDVKKGDLGGWIEKEENLSHEGDCWLYDDAKVYDDARVYDNAQVYAKAEIYGHAEIWGNTQIFCSIKIYKNTELNGEARICQVPGL